MSHRSRACGGSYDYFAPKDFPLKTGPFWQHVSTVPSSQSDMTYSDSQIGSIKGDGCPLPGWRGLLARRIGFDSGERAGLQPRHD